MYKQLTELLIKKGRPVFAIAIGQLMYLGYQSTLEITDEDIEEVKGDAMITKKFSQEIVSTARQIAKITEEDPAFLFVFCQNVNLFDKNRNMPLEQNIITSVTWTVADVINAYIEQYGEKPTEDQIYEILNILDTDRLEDCSYNWETIYEAVLEAGK